MALGHNTGLKGSSRGYEKRVGLYEEAQLRIATVSAAIARRSPQPDCGQARRSDNFDLKRTYLQTNFRLQGKK